MSNKTYMVSFNKAVTPLILSKKTIGYKREFMVVESDSFKSARAFVRAKFENKTLEKGGISDIKVTELTDEQVQEYNHNLNKQKDLKNINTETE